MKIHPLEAEL